MTLNSYIILRHKHTQIFNMKKNETVLKYFSGISPALSYYQLSRKLSNDNLHEVLPVLREILNHLEEQGYLSTELIDDVKFYSITDLGRRLIV